MEVMLAEFKNQVAEMKEEILKLRQTEATIAGVKKELADLKDENTKFRQENAQLQQRVAELEKGSAGMINFDIVFQAIDEHHQRQEKKNNMVIHFLPDDNDDFEADLTQVQDLVQESGGVVDHIKEVFRMGNVRKDKKPRMLKVICDNHMTKRMLLTGQDRIRKNLDHLDLKAAGFFVRDDMTDMQREADRILRDKLERLRGANKDINLVIRDGKIVEKRGKEVLPFQE